MEKNELNIIDSGSARQVRRCLNNNGGKPSGPEAKFDFSLLIVLIIALRLKFTVSTCTPFATRGATFGRPYPLVLLHTE